MEGAEHYREAELLLSGADPRGGHHDVSKQDIARAQVHATLALAAAQVAPLVRTMMGDSERLTEWGRVINWTPAARKRCPVGKFNDAEILRCVHEPGHDGDHLFNDDEPPF